MRKVKQHKNDLLTHLGTAMRNRRLAIDITQQELATATKMHRTYITDVEAGRRNLSMLTYGKLTDALRCALSLPMLNAEKSMAGESASPLYGFRGGLSKASELLRSSHNFVQNLEIDSFELDVVANMSKLQLAVETFARNRKMYPRNAREVEEALCGRLLVNPFTNVVEAPTIGTAINEEFATRTSCLLKPGEIEYSPMNNGANYIIKGGAANGRALEGSSSGSTYVLSGNLSSHNQP